MNRELFEFDAQQRVNGVCYLCGVDEAGRGPLAGPVFAAAVILPPQVTIEGLNDSKKLSEARREQLFDRICDTALAYGIAQASVEEIESLNILQATFLAMNRAVAQLAVTPDMVLVDGNRTPTGMAWPTQTVVKGDARSASVAAASILAKVSRDRLLLELDAQYPQYGFAKHKGYGTKAHYEALSAYGPSPVHRLSFLKKFLEKEPFHG